jgi:hypothetical protein
MRVGWRVQLKLVSEREEGRERHVPFLLLRHLSVYD